MSPHDELDQLSAYLDGELEAREHARIEAHLPGCDECRTTLDALRATVADLAELPEPAPTEQDSWALRSAIARARKQPVRRWQRVAVAAGSLAAAVVAFGAFALSGGGGGGFSALDQRLTQGAGAGGSVPVLTSNQNFTLAAAHTHLLEVSGKVPLGAAITASKESANRSAGSPEALSAPAAGFAADASGGAFTSQIDRCVNIVRRSTQVLLTPFRYEVVTFESKPAFFLIFSTQERFELWVVTRDRCEVLYFAQTA